MGLFKTQGTFGAYIHAQCGNDLTGDGTRENPYATWVKSRATLGGNHLFSGISYETNPYIQSSPILTGDVNSYIQLGSILVQYPNDTQDCIFTSLTADSIICTANSRGITKNLIIKNTLQFNGINSEIQSSFINKLSLRPYVINCSIKNMINYASSTCFVKDSICTDSVNLYNISSRSNIANYPVFQNCLFRKATKWLWNATEITINWTTNPLTSTAYTTETLMQRVYNSLLFYANSLGAGTDKTYFQAILSSIDKMFQNCIVHDDSVIPIFSRYIDGQPADYTLALRSDNPALYMSTTGSYVGCYAANVNDDGHGNHITFGAVKHVDETTGLDTATAPDLLIQDPSNPAKFSASQTSLQLWNRIRTSVVEYPRGKSFAGMQSQLDSGIASRLFFGKRQEIRTTGDISQKTTAFESVEVIPYDSLPDPNTGAENDITGLSATLPRFSAPFNGECLLFYKGGTLLKFNDYNGLKTLFTGQGTVAITSGSAVVTGTSTAFTADFVKDDNIRIAGVDYKVLSVASNTSLTLTTNSAVTLSAQTYQVGVTVDKSYAIYGNWVVSNADIESYSLLLKTAKAGLTTSIPLIKWCKFELNLHYDEQ